LWKATRVKLVTVYM